MDLDQKKFENTAHDPPLTGEREILVRASLTSWAKIWTIEYINNVVKSKMNGSKLTICESERFLTRNDEN